MNAFSGLSLLAANAQNDLHNWMFFVKLSMIALAMVNLELTKANVFNDPAVINNTGVPAGVKKFGFLSLLFWSLAICAGRLTEYPAFVQAWFGF